MILTIKAITLVDIRNFYIYKFPSKKLQHNVSNQSFLFLNMQL